MPHPSASCACTRPRNTCGETLQISVVHKPKRLQSQLLKTSLVPGDKPLGGSRASLIYTRSSAEAHGTTRIPSARRSPWRWLRGESCPWQLVSIFRAAPSLPAAFPRSKLRLSACSCSHARNGKAFPHQQLLFWDKTKHMEQIWHITPEYLVYNVSLVYNISLVCNFSWILSMNFIKSL